MARLLGSVAVNRVLARLGIRPSCAVAETFDPDKVCPPAPRGAPDETQTALVGTTTDVPCDFGPGGITWICIRDTITNSEGRPRRVEEHDRSESTEIPCEGAAGALVTTLSTEAAGYGGGDVLICGAHDRWLREHWWIDGMSSGVNLRRVAGVWVTTRQPIGESPA